MLFAEQSNRWLPFDSYSTWPGVNSGVEYLFLSTLFSVNTRNKRESGRAPPCCFLSAIGQANDVAVELLLSLLNALRRKPFCCLRVFLSITVTYSRKSRYSLVAVTATEESKQKDLPTFVGQTPQSNNASCVSLPLGSQSTRLCRMKESCTTP